MNIIVAVGAAATAAVPESVVAINTANVNRYVHQKSITTAAHHISQEWQHLGQGSETRRCLRRLLGVIQVGRTRMRSGYFEHSEQVGEWTTYDKKGQVVKVTNFKPKRKSQAAAPTSQIRHLMKKAPNGQFWLGAVALSLAALITACQSTPTRTAAELKSLQGYWVCVGSGSNTSITITGNSLHYVQRNAPRKDEWWMTTFTLPARTDPQQMLVTIKDCSEPGTNTIGTVVGAIYKIEDGTLTLAARGDGNAKPPKSFEDENLGTYILRKTQPPKENTELPKTQ